MVQLGKRTKISAGGLCAWRSASAVSSDFNDGARQEVDPRTAGSLEPPWPAARNFLMEGPPLKLELSCVRRALAATVLIAPPWILSIASLSRTAIDRDDDAEMVVSPVELGVSVRCHSCPVPYGYTVARQESVSISAIRATNATKRGTGPPLDYGTHAMLARYGP